MKANEVILGKNLRTFVMELLEKQDKFPKLIDYLASLWAVSEKYKEVNQVDFALIAKIIEEAFIIPPKKIDWGFERKQIKSHYSSSLNSAEYHKEVIIPLNED